MAARDLLPGGGDPQPHYVLSEACLPGTQSYSASMSLRQSTGEACLHKRDEEWIKERETALEMIADLSQQDQIAYFQSHQNEPDIPTIHSKWDSAQAVSFGGKLTHGQAECIIETLIRLLSQRGVREMSARKGTRKAMEHWRGAMLMMAISDARWRMTISQALPRSSEMHTQPNPEVAWDYREFHDDEVHEILDYPALPVAADERLVWATEAACAELCEAVAEAEPSPLTSDMFPSRAATLVFHTPVIDSEVTPTAVLRWVLGTYEGQEVVWVTTTAPWAYPSEDKYTHLHCIPLGHVCSKHNDFLFVAQPDHLLWAALQFIHAPLCERPKAERAEVRRADKRTLSRGREASGAHIQVIDLRRRQPGEAVPEQDRHVRAHWARGHMRRQWWPSLEQHVPRWIQTHVRGNPGLGWAPGHSAAGPPKPDVVWRIRGDKDVRLAKD